MECDTIHVDHQKHCFVGYLTAGYPSRAESIDIMKACCEAGLDVLELGFPARDASMDGEVIRKAQARVDKALGQDLTYWRQVRQAVSVPIWLMGYRQDLMEKDIYLRLAEEGLYDALVIPDMEQQEREELGKKLRPFGVSVVGFINGQQTREDVDRALRGTDLIYHQLYCGPTGVAHNDSSYLPLLRYARETSNARLFAGFGINSAERVEELLQNGYHGAIIGSAIMKLLQEGQDQAYQFIRNVHNVVRSVA
ncbi:MAG: tryptophan synthase subunit alpha [Clostridia bacterium]|nr:tryptophan synthase subunit alpha [Clostridia bacterium]